MDGKLLKKYFRGECSPQERQKVLDWFSNTELKPWQEQEFYKLWQETELDDTHEIFSRNSNLILSSINQKIDERALEQETTNTSYGGGKVLNLQLRHWKWWVQAAAAVFLPLCFLWLIAGYFSGKDAENKFITVATAPGDRKTVSLEDGSRIILNAGSKIAYLQHFSAQKREITLEGEAFFEVAKDPKRPFIVRTGTLLTQALGTSFNINYRASTKDISIALATGAVKIEKETGGNKWEITNLIPGQQLIYDQTAHAYKVIAYDPMEVLSWRKSILYFKKANLEQVIQKLESWYGIKVQVSGQIPGKNKEWHFTGSYQNQSLDDVLAGIAFVKRFTYEKIGDRVIIKFR